MSASPTEAAASTHANPGDTLRTAREAKGLSLSAVAQQLNLTERALSQIEAGDFSRLPGLTFARGYVRAYAKLLELDPNRLVNEFDQHTGSGSGASPLQSLGHIDEPARLSRGLLRFFLFAVVILVGGGGLYWWQEQNARQASTPGLAVLDQIEVETADGTTQIHLLDRGEDGVELIDEPATAAAPAADESRLENDNAAAPETSQPAEASVATEPATTAETSTAVVPSEAAADPEAAPAQAASAEEPALESGQGRLTLVYTADCWTRVTDANGEVLYSALAKAGTSRTVVGKTPLDLHLGFAAGAQVTFNGESVNLSDNTRGETARLKLGQ